MKDFDLKDLYCFYKAFEGSRCAPYVASLTPECASQLTADAARKFLIRILSASDTLVSLTLSGDLAAVKSTPFWQPPTKRRRRMREEESVQDITPLGAQATTINRFYKERRDKERCKMGLPSTTVDCGTTDITVHLASLGFYNNERGNLGYVQFCSDYERRGCDTKPNFITIGSPVEASVMQIVLRGGYESGYLHSTLVYTAMESHHTIEIRDGYHVTTIVTFMHSEAGWLAKGVWTTRGICTPSLLRIRRTSDCMPSDWLRGLGFKVNVTAKIYRKLGGASGNELRQLSVEFCGIEIPLEIHKDWKIESGKSITSVT